MSQGFGQSPASSTAPHDGAQRMLLAESFFSKQLSELVASGPLRTMGTSARAGPIATAASPCMEGVILRHAPHSLAPRPAAVLCDFDHSAQYSPHVMQRQRTAAEFYPGTSLSPSELRNYPERENFNALMDPPPMIVHVHNNTGGTAVNSAYEMYRLPPPNKN
jgi:hypothetical protein